MWFAFAAGVGFAAEAPPPTVPMCAVVRPMYTIDGRNVAAGTMFAARIGDRTVLVTAHQLFGPAGGQPTQIAPADLPAHVTALTAWDAVTKTACGKSSRTLVIADAAPMDHTQSDRDVAAFLPATTTATESVSRSAGAGFTALPLATQPPKVGDRVFLAAPIVGQEGLLHPAKILAVDPGVLYYSYDDPKIDLASTNGAPVLDASGAVVGMALGGGTMPDGMLVGNANAASSLQTRIIAALAVPVPP